MPEPIAVISDWGLNFAMGCALKYIARADLRGDPITDLRKAIEYIELEIQAREKPSHLELIRGRRGAPMVKLSEEDK